MQRSALKSHFVSQVWASERGVAGGGFALLWFLKITAKGCFFSFEWEISNFTTFVPLKKFEKSPVALPWKNSFRRPRSQVVQGNAKMRNRYARNTFKSEINYVKIGIPQTVFFQNSVLRLREN